MTLEEEGVNENEIKSNSNRRIYETLQPLITFFLN